MGMILLSELSRRRIRSINKLIRVGKTEPVVVIRVDKDKGYIDLSKRRVSKEDIERCTEKYSKAKAVNSIVRHVAEILGLKTNDELEDLYRKTAWYFENRAKKQGTAYDYFKQSVADPTLLDALDLDEKTKEVLVENIQRKLTQQAVKIRADFECSCFTYEGIDAVKEALRAGIGAGNPEIPIKINLIAPPVYVMTCSTPDKTDGLAVLTEGCKAVEEEILPYRWRPRWSPLPTKMNLLPRSEKLRKRMLTSAVTSMTRGGKSLGTRGRALRTRSEGERGSVYCDVQTRVLCNAVLQYCSTVQCSINYLLC